MVRAALTATEDDHESNLPTSRGRGGRSQQVQAVRIDRVENFVQNFYGATSRACDYQVRLWHEGRARRRGRSVSLPHAQRRCHEEPKRHCAHRPHRCRS